MSLLGIDIGTTGCKVAAFSEAGTCLGLAYEEYAVQRPTAGYSELDAASVWERTQRAIRQVAARTRHDPIRAAAVSSLGEAVVLVTRDRRILGSSILNDDIRGKEFLSPIRERFPNDVLYGITGNTLGNHFTLTKLLWLKAHAPELFQAADLFLPWSSFVPFMLGAAPCVDYSLANRTLCFNVREKKWSDEILDWAGIDTGKLPVPISSGRAIGTIAPDMADALDLPHDMVLVAGAHDQCANAVGCGAVQEGRTMLGMGTYLCMAPLFRHPPSPELMIPRGLNTEHHAINGLFVCFIYNQGGCLLKWYRDTFARAEQAEAQRNGQDIYPLLLQEMPSGPSKTVVLPHFISTGPPDFITDSCGVMAGLHLATSRGDILRGILEGTVFYLRESLDALPATGIEVSDFRVVGGGSKSPPWVRLCADILGRPCATLAFPEAGVMGAAILAGAGCGAYATPLEGVNAMVSLDQRIEPNPTTHRQYDDRYDRYKRLWPLLRDYLQSL